jgi:cysteine-rich repeat protein
MKAMRVFSVLFVSLLILVGCGTGSTPAGDTLGDTNLPQGCVPGDTQACLCVGGGSGVQICADDGTRWGPCQGCVVADIIVNDVQPDTVVPIDVVTPGDTIADVVTDILTDTVQPYHGTCSGTGVQCDTDNDCMPDSVVVSGFCVIRNDNPGVECMYNARFDTASQVTCDGNNVFKCDTDLECPEGLFCGSFGDNWCDISIPGVCTNRMSSGITDCTSNSLCNRTVANYCVFCGNDEVDGTMEECDDGARVDGDGCSSTCMFEMFCFDSFGDQIDDAKCATADDCIDECMDPPCTCSSLI